MTHTTFHSTASVRRIPGRWLVLALLLLVVVLVCPPRAIAQAPLRLLLTGSRVTDTFIPAGSSDTVTPGGLATYSLMIENDQSAERRIDAAIALPEGARLVDGSLRVNGLPSTTTVITAGNQVAWPGLVVPAAHTGDNLAGVHVFLRKEPSFAEIDQRLAWAAHIVGPGGTIKLFHPSITEHTTAPFYWMVYAVRRAYQLGLRPVVRLGFANGDTSSFTRRHDDPVGQMNRADAAGGYWGIGWGTRYVVAGLLAETADAAAAAHSSELTVIIGNEPNLEWVDRDWFIDYSYVREADGSFDPSWLTTDPADPTAAANSPTGWRRFVRGIPTAEHPRPSYDTRLDEYRSYLGYDAAIEYGRFLLTTSSLLKGLDDPRLQIAAGAIASGGGDLEGRYAYHQRHFIRRMLLTVPDALRYIDLWTTNNYPYTITPANNYHAHPANFDRYPLGEPYWQTEIGIDSYRGDLDYLAYLKRKGVTKSVPTRAIIGEVGYGIGPGWGTDFGGPPLTEDLRARYMADIFERYYNDWHAELANVNLWQLGDPDHAQAAYHMFDMVYPDSETVEGWPTHRHLVYDAVAARASQPGPGRLIVTFQVRLPPTLTPGPLPALATITGGVQSSYNLVLPTPASPAMP